MEHQARWSHWLSKSADNSRMRRRFFSNHARVNVDLDAYVLAELVEHDHQAVNGEAAKLHVTNVGKIR